MQIFRVPIEMLCFPIGIFYLPLAVLRVPLGVFRCRIRGVPDKAKVVYAESAEATLARYELRGNPGSEYNAEDAVVIAINLPGEPREFLTDFGLTQPGTSASYKVYVVLTTGNEAGSAGMTMARPA